MNKKRIKALCKKAEDKYSEAQSAVIDVNSAITFVGFAPGDEPSINYIDGDGLCLYWDHGQGKEIYDWLSLLDDNNCISRGQVESARC